MKNVLSLLLISLAFSVKVFSQCTPPAPTGNPGLSPAPANVTCIERGVPYDFTLNFENFSSFSCSGFSVSVNSATIDDLDNLPCGITWQADQSSYTAGETGCIRITGTSTDAVGQYPLTVYMTFNLNILGSPYTVSGSIPDLIQQMTDVGCTAPSVNTNYFSRVINPGTCPAIGTLTNATSSGTTCPPPIAVSISGNTTICSGSPTTLTANVTNSTGTVTYAWSTSGNTASVNVSPTATASYTVTVTDQNGSATASATVTVNQRPNAAFTASVIGASATVSNTTSGATSYSWNFGDSQTSTSQNPAAHNYTANGTYTITLIATNSCGSDTATQQVTITGTTGPTVSISGNTSICEGASTTLTANPSNATGAVTYSWSSGGNTQAILVSPASTATYSVTITAQNGSATASSPVTVNQIPTASFTASTTGAITTIMNTSSGASSYSWDFGDGQTSVAQNPSVHTYSANGNFTITLIATNSCGSDTATQNVTTVGVGIGSIKTHPITLNVYPNPFYSTATVEVENITGTFDFAVYTVTGLKVYERSGLAEHKFTIQKGALAQGVYFIEVSTEKLLGRKKLVIY